MPTLCKTPITKFDFLDNTQQMAGTIWTTNGDEEKNARLYYGQTKTVLIDKGLAKGL